MENMVKGTEGRFETGRVEGGARKGLGWYCACLTYMRAQGPSAALGKRSVVVCAYDLSTHGVAAGRSTQS